MPSLYRLGRLGVVGVAVKVCYVGKLRRASSKVDAVSGWSEMVCACEEPSVVANMPMLSRLPLTMAVPEVPFLSGI